MGMRDWQFATVDVTANGIVKVTVMESRCNTPVTRTVYMVHNVQSRWSSISCNVSVSHVLKAAIRLFCMTSILKFWSIFGRSPVRDAAEKHTRPVWSLKNKTIRGVLVIQTASLSPSQFFVPIQFNSSHMLLSPFSLWLTSPNDSGSSANVVGDVFGKISIFSRWGDPCWEKKEGEACEILLSRGLPYFIAISSTGPSAAWQLFPAIAPTSILSPQPDLPRVWTLNTIFI